jgi:hypothetical protein
MNFVLLAYVRKAKYHQSSPFLSHTAFLAVPTLFHSLPTMTKPPRWSFTPLNIALPILPWSITTTDSNTSDSKFTFPTGSPVSHTFHYRVEHTVTGQTTYTNPPCDYGWIGKYFYQQ